MANEFFNRILLVFRGAIVFVFLGSQAFAANELAQTFTVDGQLMLSGTTTVLTDAAAKITVEILDPSKTCLLYAEQQTVDTTSSEGYFSIQVGSVTGASKRVSGDPGLTMAQVYQNTSAVTAASAPGATCAGGTYTPAANAVRYFRIIVTPSSTNVADTLSPDTVLDAVPMATVAQTLQGYAASDFLTTAGLPTCGSGTFLSYNGTTLSCAGVSGASGGTVTSITAGTGLSGGTITTSGAIALTASGVTAATYGSATQVPVIAVDTYGRVTSATNTTISGVVPGGTASGDLAGTYPSPTVSGLSGTALSISSLTSGQYLKYNGTNWINSTLSVSDSSITYGSETQNTFLAAPNGSNGAPTFRAIVAADLPIVPYTRGGTGLTGTPANGQIAIGNGAGYTLGTLTAGSGVTITNTSGAITIASSGAGGTITALTGDVSASGSGSVAATVNSVGGSTAANVHSAELLANAATNANTASTIVRRDASGNFSAGNITANVTGASSLNVLKAGDSMTGNLTFASAKGTVYTDSTTNTVTLEAPTTVTSYVLKLPGAVATSSGQVLTSDTSGNLSWTTPSTAATSYSGILPIANGGTNSSTALNNNQLMVSSGGKIIEAGALTNGQLFIGSTGAAPVAASLTAGSGITITPAAGAITIATTGLQASSLANGDIWVGQTGTPTAVAPSGDVTMTNAGAFTVTQIQGKAVSATQPSSTGQVLRYNGTSWTPNFLSMFDLRSTITGTQAFGGVGCLSNQTLTWTATTDNLSCSNIAISGTQVTYGSQTANTIFAAPNGSSGAPTFRAIASADLPSGTLSGSGAANYVPYYSATTTLASSPIYVSSGNVGVGTTLPAGSFDVENSSNTAQICLNGACSSSLGSQWTTSGSNIYYNSGSVGIGTATPAAIYPLDVNGAIHTSSRFVAATTDQAQIGGDWGGDGEVPSGAYVFSTKASLSLMPSSQSGTAGDKVAIGYFTGGSGNSALEVANVSSGFSNLLVMKSGGNVGIGTTSPAGTLDVEGGTSTSGAGVPINLVAQNAQAGTSNVGGNVNITAGTSTRITSGGSVGGAVSIVGGGGAWISGPIPKGRGGSATLQGGAGSGVSSGGVAEMIGGNGGTTSGAGGSAIVIGGAPTEGVGGSVNILGAAAVSTLGTGNYTGGSIGIVGGVAAGTGGGGPINITAGNANSIGNGGIITMSGGNDTSSYASIIMQPSGGYVGIGTTSPQAKLNIGGTAGTDGIMFPDGTLQTTASPAYVVSCTKYGSSTGGVCVRATTSTGATSCKYSTTPGSSSWSACTSNPFSAGTTGGYSISCSTYGTGGSTVVFCIEMNSSTGTSSCMATTDPSSVAWAACANSPF